MKKKILFIILTILIIAAAIITYNTFNKNNSIKKYERKHIQLLYSRIYSGVDVIIDKKGNAYLKIIDYKDDYPIKKAKKQELKSQYKEYIIEGYHEDVSGCNNKEKKNIFEGIKIPVENVVSAYEIDNGQEEGGNAILFIKKDGTVSGFNIYNFITNGYIKVFDNIDDLKDIVSIVQSASCYYVCGSASHITYAIDKQGQFHPIKESFIEK